MSDFICQKYTDCSSCSHYQKQIFKYRSFLKGMMIPKERCSQNTIYFLISGSVRVTSDEHPGTVVKAIISEKPTMAFKGVRIS